MTVQEIINKLTDDGEYRFEDAIADSLCDSGIKKLIYKAKDFLNIVDNPENLRFDLDALELNTETGKGNIPYSLIYMSKDGYIYPYENYVYFELVEEKPYVVFNKEIK